jgi:hypothetical protein
MRKDAPKFRGRFCGPGKRFLANVRVAVAHSRTLMADQCLDDTIGNAGVFEQRDCRVTKRVETHVQSRALTAPAGAAALVVP